MIKVFKVEDVEAVKTQMGTRTDLVGAKTGAKEFGFMIVTAEPGKGMPYHYHRHRESMYLVLEGKAKAVFEGKEYILEPNSVVFIPAGMKHKTTNIGDNDYKYIEVYSSPGRDDLVVVQGDE
ncbi:MAG: cupin domain-containing protein [Candidatus Bathyarchaeia archaeon]